MTIWVDTVILFREPKKGVLNHYERQLVLSLKARPPKN